MKRVYSWLSLFFQATLLFLPYLQMECRAMKYFPAHISWTTGSRQGRRMLSNEARKCTNYAKISFQICFVTKRFWGNSVCIFMVGLHLKKSFQCKKLFSPCCYCCASNAFLPYITVFLTKYMQGSKPCCHFPAFQDFLGKIRDFWKRFEVLWCHQQNLL